MNDNQEKMPEEKRIRQIVSEGASKNNSTPFRKILSIFLDVAQIELNEKFKPVARDIFADTVIDIFRGVLYRNDSRKSVYTGGSSFGSGSSYRNYSKISVSPSPITGQKAEPIGMAHSTYSDVKVKSRMDAEEVLDYLGEIISGFHAASVADLYDMVGIRSEYTDQNYGWTDLQGACVQRAYDGWIIHLPRPVLIH